MNNTIIISVSVWILSAIVYVIYNLYNKNKKLENIVLKQNDYISDMTQLYKDYSQLSEKIDSTIWVQSDPELLSLFEKIKEMKNKTDEYLS